MNLDRSFVDRAIGRSTHPAVMCRSQRSSGKMSVRSVILITVVLSIFATLHIIGGTLVFQRTHRLSGEFLVPMHMGD